jgi:hypothetical protein
MHFGFASIGSRWLFNPKLIQNKAVTDLVSSLLRVRPEIEDRTTLLSSAYLTLLSIVLAQPRLPGCSSVQFAIVRTSSSLHARRVELVFLSEIHEVVDLPTYVH